MIKFSIITVTFNAGRAFSTTADSVLSQIYSEVEHIVVDGASTDGTLDLARRYAQRNEESASGHEVVVRSEPDKGIYDAMQKGLNMATGDYVCFLNAGDWLPSADTLLTIADKIDLDCRPGVLYGDTDIVDDEGRFLRHRRLEAPERLTALSFLHGMLVCHQSFYARTDIARVTAYDLRYRYSADYDWCIRVLRSAERRGLAVHNTKLVLTDYLAEGLTTRNHRRSLMERLRLMARHYGWFRALAMHTWFVVRAVVKQ